MHKRIAVIFPVFMLMICVIFFRMLYLSKGEHLKAAASSQSVYTLKVSSTRGVIYDRNLVPLVNTKPRYIAAIMPTPEAAATVTSTFTGDARSLALEQMRSRRPFAVDVDTPDIYSGGIDVVTTSYRYGDETLAPHIIGHMNGDYTAGAVGIERAYNDFLEATGRDVSVRYIIDASGRTFNGIPPEVITRKSDGKPGVVLTLDSEIQMIAQQAAKRIKRGAVVVMDVYTGDILASVSLPGFDPNNLPKSLNDPDSPFINRAFLPYNVGSTFKLFVAAAALDNGIPRSFSYTCSTYIDVHGKTFKCHNDYGHGEIDMLTAIERSCNPYFINLGLTLGAENILIASQALGFGSSVEVAPTIRTDSGYLPSYNELQNPADVANLSFGQGLLLATPVQIACGISAIANGGVSVIPRLVEGSTLDGIEITDKKPVYSGNQVVRPKTAATLREFMISAVENGSGTKAKPEFGGAGGKTASAQTGTYRDGEEIVHAWFSGFYPADVPKYAIVVLVEEGDSGGDSAAPVFKEISDLLFLKKK